MADEKKGSIGTNDWVKDKHKLNPVPSFNFALEVEAMFFMPLKSVRVFNKENEFEYYQEGGLNDYVHMLRKPVSKPFTFQVERYVGTSANTDFATSFIDPIALGTELILPVILYVTRFPASNSGDNFNPNNTPRCYIFTGCVVTAKEYGELNAERSGLYTETTTIAYKELFVMNGLSTDWEGRELWEFPKDANNKGNKPKNKIKWSDKDTVKPASLWEFPKDANNKGNKPKNKIKWSDKDTVKPASQWEYTGDVKGKGPRHDLYEKAAENNGKKPKPSQWEYDGTVKGKGDRHDLYQKAAANNGKKEDGKPWNIKEAKSPYQPSKGIKWSDKDTKKDPSKWEYDGTVKGKGTSHDTNKKAGGEKKDGTPWNIDSASSPYKPNDYVHWSDKDTKKNPVVWEYDGTVQGKGTRRALMANELAK